MEPGVRNEPRVFAEEPGLPMSRGLLQRSWGVGGCNDGAGVVLFRFKTVLFHRHKDSNIIEARSQTTICTYYIF